MTLRNRTACFALCALIAAAGSACGDDDDALTDDGDGQGTAADAAGGDGAADAASGGEVDAAPGGEDGGGRLDGGALDGAAVEDAGSLPDGGDLDGGAAPDASPADGGPLDGGGAPDAGPADGGVPDGGAPDAGPDPFDGEFLLSIRVDLFPNAPIRLITTVDFTPGGEGGTADFTFQPIKFGGCAPEGNGGLPVGDPFTAAGIGVDGAGAFEIGLADVTLPAGANTPLCIELTAESINVAGTVRGPDLTCGEVTVGALGGQLTGTFGAIRIPPGTVGDANLPEPVTECPAGLRP